MISLKHEDVIYWAVKLYQSDTVLLLSEFSPIHENIFGEHVTLAFRPSLDIHNKMLQHLGERIALGVIKYVFDYKAQAIVVNGINRTDGGTPHITISCRSDTRPIYSNTMINSSASNVDISKNLILNGVVAAYTKNGWVIG